MVTRPSSSCMAAKMRASTRKGLWAAPPNRPEWRSRSAQGCGHHRRRRVPHAGIADQREVELELLGIVLDEAEQVVRTAFLLPLNYHGDGKRQLARDGFERAACLHEGHHLAF